MILNIDTENKTIGINESVNLKDLFDVLQELFPENKWHDYSLDVINNNFVEYEPPYVFDKSPPYMYFNTHDTFVDDSEYYSKIECGEEDFKQKISDNKTKFTIRIGE